MLALGASVSDDSGGAGAALALAALALSGGSLALALMARHLVHIGPQPNDPRSI
jgi:hypothetical protein